MNISLGKSLEKFSFSSLPLETVKSRISMPHFLRGLAVGGGIYVLFGLYAVFFAGTSESEALSKIPPRLYEVERTAAQAENTLQPGDHAMPAGQDHTTLAASGGLFEETTQGMLPRKSAEGGTPFSVYRRPYEYQGRPVIALAAMDYGMSESDSREALAKLPENITFIVNPYADNLDRWRADARAQGRELWLYVPSETNNFPYTDPGPQGLLADLDSTGNRDRLHWLMGRTKEYAGVALNNDETLLSSRLSLQKIVDDIFDRGLGYMDINKSSPSFYEVNAIGRNAPYVRSQEMLGAGGDDAAILGALERQARESGSSMTVMKLHPQSIKTISEWAATLKGKGIDLAPVSAIAATQPEPQQ